MVNIATNIDLLADAKWTEGFSVIIRTQSSAFFTVQLFGRRDVVA